MNKKQFLKVITEVVRREVKKEVKKIFIREQSSPQMSLTDEAGKQSKDIKYTKNKSLNDVLNETAASEEWKTMGGSKFDSSRMNELVGRQYGDMINQQTQVVPSTDPMAQFVNKNYSEVLEKSIKKSNRKFGNR